MTQNTYSVTLILHSPDNIESVKRTCEELTSPLMTPENITVERVEVIQVSVGTPETLTEVLGVLSK